MGQVFSILIIVGGGLGTFLLGMKHLSEGLQAVSGSGLRRFMSLATTHRLAGVGEFVDRWYKNGGEAVTERVRAWYAGKQ